MQRHLNKINRKCSLEIKARCKGRLIFSFYTFLLLFQIQAGLHPRSYARFFFIDLKKLQYIDRPISPHGPNYSPPSESEHTTHVGPDQPINYHPINCPDKPNSENNN